MLALREQVAAKANATSYTFTFPTISQGMAASVTVSVPGAPPTATWTVYAGALPVATLAGPNALSSLYLIGGEAASIQGTSASDPGQAVEVGQLGSLSEVPVTVPVPAPGATNIGAAISVTGTLDVQTAIGETVDVSGSSVAIASGTVDANITNATLTVDGTVSLTAGQVVEVTNQAGGSLTVAGTVDATVQNATIESGTVNIGTLGVGNELLAGPLAYDTTTVAVTPPAGTGCLVIPNIAIGNRLWVTAGILPQGVYLPVRNVTTQVNTEVAAATSTWYADLPFTDGKTTYEVTLLGANMDGATQLEWLVYANTGVDQVIVTSPVDPVQTISVVNPAAGAGWSFALPWPAKVKAVTAQLDSAAGGSNPVLDVAGVQLYWETGTLSTGTYYLKAWPGPPALAVVSQFGNILLAIPDMGVLPAGATITGTGQAAGDQWSNINVVLEPA